jgi:hypothetical protein
MLSLRIFGVMLRLRNRSISASIDLNRVPQLNTFAVRSPKPRAILMGQHSESVGNFGFKTSKAPVAKKPPAKTGSTAN